MIVSPSVAEGRLSWVGLTLSGEPLNRTGSSGQKRFKVREGFHGRESLSIDGFENGGGLWEGIWWASRS